MLRWFHDGLWVRNKQKIKFIPYESITHIYYSDGISEIHTGQQLAKKINMPLAVIENLFPKNKFFRIHRNFIINKAFVIHCDPAGKYIFCKHGEQIPISRRKVKHFQLFINN
jgi:DNA-binding LytR/AlgR family response regulator